MKINECFLFANHVLNAKKCFHLILIVTLDDRQHYPHFTDEEAEAYRG